MARIGYVWIVGLSCIVGSAAGAQGPAPADAPVRSTPFPDVPQTHWAHDAVEHLRVLGILRGYPAAPRAPTPSVRRARSRKPGHAPNGAPARR